MTLLPSRDPLASLAALGVHDHTCLVYRESADQREVVAAYLRLGLERGERCLLVAGDDVRAGVLSAVAESGVDVDVAVARGALLTVDTDAVCRTDGGFRPDRVLDRLDERVRRARSDGFPALRVAVEMPAVIADADVAALPAYEARVDAYCAGHDVLVLCQYDLGHLSPALVCEALSTHPWVVWGGELCKNHFYIPPEQFLAPPEAGVVLARRLASILARCRGEVEVERTREEVVQGNADLRAARAELERRVGERTEELVAVNRDLRLEIAEHREAETALAHERNLVNVVLDGAPTMVVVLDRDARFVRFNRTCERLSGYAADEALGRVLWELVVPLEEVAQVKDAFDSLIDGTASRPYRFENRWRRRDGGSILTEWSAEVLYDERGEIAFVAGVGVDITERRALEEELRELALRDDLTDLLNRRGFTTLAEQLLRVAVRMGRGVGLIYADCDNMKRINDRCGHAAGDEALRETAQVLREAVRDADVVGRIGGDEFAVLLVDAHRPVLEGVLSRIDEAVRRHNNEVKAGRRERAGRYRLSLSAGGALFDPQALDPAALAAGAAVALEQLVDEADRAMYSRKGRR